MRGVRELPSSFEELEDFKIERLRPTLTAEERDVLLREAHAAGIRKTIHGLYFEEGLTQREVAESFGISRSKVQNVFKVMGWTARRQKRSITNEEVLVLYEKEGLTQAEIAKRFNVSKSYIYKILKEEIPEDLRKQRRIDIDLEDLYHFYCDIGLSQSDIAKALGVGQTTLSRKIRELGWERKGRKSHVDTFELHRLYFEEGYSQKEAAVSLGVPLICVRARFTEMGWKAGPRGTIIDVEEAYRLLNEDKKDRNEVAVILGVSQSRLEKALEKMEQQDVHWLNKEHGSNSYRREAKEIRESPRMDSVESIRTRRFNLFGDECVICKRHAEDFKLVLHRKDGKSHHRNSTWTEEFLQTAIVDDWVMLCDRCHTGVHWFMEQYDVKWDWINQHMS